MTWIWELVLAIQKVDFVFRWVDFTFQAVDFTI